MDKIITIAGECCTNDAHLEGLSAENMLEEGLS